jgi:hypothetical protein
MMWLVRRYLESPTLTSTLQIAHPPASPKMMHRMQAKDMDTAGPSISDLIVVQLCAYI